MSSFIKNAYSSVVFSFAIITSGFLSQDTFANDAAQIEKGKKLYATCIACHGAKAEGNKALNAPKLTGLDTWYVERQLKNFKEGLRGTNPKDIYGQQMRPMAMTLPDDAAISAVAAYIASLK